MATRVKKKKPAMGTVKPGQSYAVPFAQGTFTQPPASQAAANQQTAATAAQAYAQQLAAPPTFVAPFDLEAEKTRLGGQRDQRLGYLGGERTRMLMDFGFRDQDGDPATADFVVDPSNPLSRAHALQLSYQRARRGDQTSYGAAGQIRSGAYQRQQNFRDTSEQNDSGQLLKALLAGNAQIGQQEAETRSWYDNAVAEQGQAWAAGHRAVPAPLPTAGSVGLGAMDRDMNVAPGARIVQGLPGQVPVSLDQARAGVAWWQETPEQRRRRLARGG